MADLIGQRIGPYQILAQLGMGGMAVVYKAHDSKLNRTVAIKIIKTDLAASSDFVRRFEREARTVAALSHPHILKVFDFGQYENTVYLVMEMMPGGNLSDRIRRERMTNEAVTETLDQIARALDYAHRAGIVHRDLKPPNVLLDSDENVFLTDFGIAKMLQETSNLTASGTVMGTPSYMSPEQWSGQPVDGRSDIYSLGVILYEMLAGSVPFNGDTPFRLMHQHIYEPPPSIHALRPDIPAGVQTVLSRALAKNREERYTSAGELVTAFKAGLAGTLAAPVPTPQRDATYVIPGVGASSATPLPAAPPRPPATIRPFWLIGGAALLVLIAATGVFIATRPPVTTVVRTQASRASEGIDTLLPTGSYRDIVSSTPVPIAANATNTSAPTNTIPQPTNDGTGTQTANLNQTVTAQSIAISLNKTIDARFTLTANAQPTSTPKISTPTPVPATDTVVPPTQTPTFTPGPLTDTPVPPSATATDTAIPAAKLEIATIAIPSETANVVVSGQSAYLPVVVTIANTGTAPTTSFQVRARIGNATPAQLTYSQPIPPGQTTTLRLNLSVLATGNVQIEVTLTPKDQAAVTSSKAVTLTALTPIPPTASPTLTPAPPTETSTPAPLGGGKGKIVFFSTRRNTNDLYVMNADGSDVQGITKADGPEPENGGVNVFPDGTRILFSSNRAGDFQIWSMKLDGTDPQQITVGSPLNLNPVMAPNGKLIAFVSTRENNNFDIYLMNADGTNQRRVTTFEGYDTEASWAPDSKKFVFMTGRTGKFQLFTYTLDTDKTERLTNTNFNERSPNWSPDGTRIAFDSDRSGTREIWVMNLTGNKEVKQLTKSAKGTLNSWPCWSPDGQYLLFTSNRDGNTEVYRMKADGSDVTRLTESPKSDGDAGAKWLP